MLKTLYRTVPRSTTDNSQPLETTQTLNRRMDKQSVVYPYNAILSSHKKEWGTQTRFNADESWKGYAQWEQPDTPTKTHTVQFHLHEISRINKPRERENRLVVAKGWGQEQQNQTVNSGYTQHCKCTNATELHTFSRFFDGNFRLCVFSYSLCVVALGLHCCLGAFSRGYSSRQRTAFSSWLCPLFQSTGSRCSGFSGCREQTQ